MTIDRTPAHLSDMLGFVRELLVIVGATALELAAVELALAKSLAARDDA